MKTSVLFFLHVVSLQLPSTTASTHPILIRSVKPLLRDGLLMNLIPFKEVAYTGDMCVCLQACLKSYTTQGLPELCYVEISNGKCKLTSLGLSSFALQRTKPGEASTAFVVDFNPTKTCSSA